MVVLVQSLHMTILSSSLLEPTNFVSNSAVYGGAIFSEDNTALNFNETNNFTNNSVKGGGAIYTLDNPVVSFSGTNNFTNNSAEVVQSFQMPTL